MPAGGGGGEASLDGSGPTPLAASVLSIAELCGGVREGEEHSRLDAFVATSVRPQPWQQAGATLATLNRGHFPMLADVLVPSPDPDGAPPAAGLLMVKQTSSTSAVNPQAPQPLAFALQGRASSWRSRDGKYWCTIKKAARARLG